MKDGLWTTISEKEPVVGKYYVVFGKGFHRSMQCIWHEFNAKYIGRPKQWKTKNCYEKITHYKEY